MHRTMILLLVLVSGLVELIGSTSENYDYNLAAGHGQDHDLSSLWEMFKAENRKTYDDAEEEAKR